MGYWYHDFDTEPFLLQGTGQTQLWHRGRWVVCKVEEPEKQSYRSSHLGMEQQYTTVLLDGKLSILLLVLMKHFEP